MNHENQDTEQSRPPSPGAGGPGPTGQQPAPTLQTRDTLLLTWGLGQGGCETRCQDEPRVPHRGGIWVDPWFGEIPHAVQQASLRVTATEPRHPGELLHTQRSLLKRGTRAATKGRSRSPQPKVPHTAAKIQCSKANEETERMEKKNSFLTSPRAWLLFGATSLHFCTAFHCAMISPLYIPLSCPQTRRWMAGLHIRDTTPENRLTRGHTGKGLSIYCPRAQLLGHLRLFNTAPSGLPKRQYDV